MLNWINFWFLKLLYTFLVNQTELIEQAKAPADIPGSESTPESIQDQNPLSTPQNNATGSDTVISRESFPAESNTDTYFQRESNSSSSTETIDHELNSNVVFDAALINYGSRKCFILGLFLLCTSPGILNGFHVMVYVFYGHTPKHWCAVPILDNAGWTPEQIRNISSPKPGEWSNCEYYKLNYNELEKMSYQEAMENVKSVRKHDLLECTEYSYELEGIGTSIVPEWDLVCKRLALKATVQTAVSVGKFLGAFTFGIIADRFGRKVSFAIACCIYILAGPIIALTSLYQLVIAARICLGIAGLGVFESGYTIVSEICPPKLRSTVGVLYNQSYPVGILGTALIAYYVRDWRNLQLCISVPALFLVFHMWFIPESPRWLYYSGRKKRAWAIVGKYSMGDPVTSFRRINDPGRTVSKNSCLMRFRRKLSNCSSYLNHKEFTVRLIVCCIVWFFTAMSYYALTINSASLKADPYVYVGLSGVVEATSYIIPVPLLRFVGRRTVATGLLLTASLALLLLLIIPSNMTGCKVAASLLGRLCVSATFSVIIIHAFELFPTMTRNTAVGTSSTMAHAGSFFAPYLVDFFAEYGWFIPSTICGLGLLLAGLLTQTLPETKDLALYDTLDDLSNRCRTNPEEEVSIKNCAPCYLFGKHTTV